MQTVDVNQGDTVIIPTPEFDPMFADDGIPFRAKMIDYINREFADLLGSKFGLLRYEEGLDDFERTTAFSISGESIRSAA